MTDTTELVASKAAHIESAKKAVDELQEFSSMLTVALQSLEDCSAKLIQQREDDTIVHKNKLWHDLANAAHKVHMFAYYIGNSASEIDTACDGIVKPLQQIRATLEPQNDGPA